MSNPENFIPKDFMLRNKISDSMLELVELYNELPTSDLQAIADARAREIIKLVTQNI